MANRLLRKRGLNGIFDDDSNENNNFKGFDDDEIDNKRGTGRVYDSDSGSEMDFGDNDMSDDD